MRRNLDAWSANLPDPEPRQERDERTLEELRALGYVV